MKWSDGDEYTGDFKDGQYHGHGVYKYNNGDRYEGQFEYDCGRHGQGTMYYANGEKYEGGWLNDEKHGEGVLTTPDGT